MNETNFQTNDLSLVIVSRNFVIRLYLDSLAFSSFLIALKMRAFHLCLLALNFVLTFNRRFLFFVHSIQVSNKIFVYQSKSNKRIFLRKRIEYCSFDFCLCYICYREKEISYYVYTSCQRDMHIFSFNIL